MQPKNMPFLQSSCVDSSRSGLNALSSATRWTPAFSEVRRSNETEKRRGEWQRNLYLSAMTNEESPPYAQWPFVIRNAIVHEHGSDAASLTNSLRLLSLCLFGCLVQSVVDHLSAPSLRLDHVLLLSLCLFGCLVKSVVDHLSAPSLSLPVWLLGPKRR